MQKTSSKQTDSEAAEPRFAIGQNVQLKTGGPIMVVNQCTRDADGKLVVDTIWFDVSDKKEARGTFQEELLYATDLPLNKKARPGYPSRTLR
jgi:uncharacterized protein YodC (DUF2158 family)